MDFENMDDFATRLKNEILKGLPGTETQWQMASSDRLVKNFPRVPGNDARVAAVLILYELLTILKRGYFFLPE